MKSMYAAFLSGVLSVTPFLVPPSWAAYKGSIPATVQLHVSPRGGWSGSTANVPPTAQFGAFSQDEHGKFLTVATGPEFINLISGRSASFIGQLSPERCTIAGAPFQFGQVDWDSKSTLYKEQTRQLHACLQMRVEDPSGVKPAGNQQACRMEILSEKAVLASGGVCYFQITPISNFTIRYELKPECQDPSRYADLQLGAFDIGAFSGFYISGDSSGQSLQLKPLGSTALRLTIEPLSASVSMSTDMGKGSPRWPVVVHPDAHIAQFEIFKREEDSRSLINTNIFAESACRDEQNEACYFGYPLGAQFSLREVQPSGRTLLVEQWYSGGSVPAFWQGFIPASRELTFTAFRKGYRYRLEADFTYLSIYHRLFKEGFRNFLVSLGLWSIDHTQPLVPLRPVAVTPALQAFKSNPPVPDLQPLTAGGINDISLELNRMRSLLSDVTWPPFYEKMCGTEGCVRALEGQAQLLAGVEFTFDGFENGKAKTTAYRTWRRSAFLPDYDLEVKEMMRPECK